MPSEPQVKETRWSIQPCRSVEEFVSHSQNVAASVHLTPASDESVALVGEGMSNRAIGTHLGVSERTVEGHLNHVFSKMGMEGRTELVRFAVTSEQSTSDLSMS